MRPEWTNKGLAWIEAFDHIPLRQILETMRGLEFSDEDVNRHLCQCVRRKLRRHFGPDADAAPKKKVYAKRKPEALRRAA
jgi:hypothetical protein